MSGTESKQSIVPHLHIGNELAEKLVNSLTAEAKLPQDFYFRLLGVAYEQRSDVAVTDILAALGFGEESEAAAEYLHGDLPDCVLIPGGGDTLPLRPILAQLSEDYYRFADLSPIAQGQDIPLHTAVQTWRSLINHLNPSLGSYMEDHLAPKGYRWPGQQSRDSILSFYIGRTVIRDTAALDIYQGRREVSGFGRVRMNLLHSLLLDNHPELEHPELELIEIPED